MIVVEEIQAEIAQRRLPSGGWSFLARGVQPALEPTCLALLALSVHTPAQELQPVLHLWRHDRSWGAFEEDQGGSGLTGLALLTLNVLGVQGKVQQQSTNWLLGISGHEAHWPWKWKFRTTDTRVHFDPGKSGWPWQPGTCSWVVPTAFAVLALKRTSRNQPRGKAALRIRHGVEMLLDRACPGGGWNAGNGIVYGHSMAPHIDATAIALLAQRTEPHNAIIESSLGWLKRQAYSCRALWSLSWAVLALNAYNEPVGALQQRLGVLVKPARISDNATLAVVALALECDTRGSVFEVCL